jgi:hypothetical protein
VRASSKAQWRADTAGSCSMSLRLLSQIAIYALQKSAVFDTTISYQL